VIVIVIVNVIVIVIGWCARARARRSVKRAPRDPFTITITFTSTITTARRLRLGVLALLLSACTGTRSQPSADVSHVAHARAGVHCTRCHGDLGAGSAPHLPEDATCAACHADAHPGQEDRKCTGCHVDPDARTTLIEAAGALRFDHGQHLPRVNGDCVQCHRGAISPDAEHPGALPAMNDCRSCHAKWLDDVTCDRCHVSLALYPLRPVGALAHQADFLRRHALEARAAPDRCAQCHTQSSCADCHDRRAPMAPEVAFADRPDRAFVHRPGYAAWHGADARLDGASCLGCHGETSCVACHSLYGNGPGGPSPHPRDWASPGPGPNTHAAAARRDLMSCAACHSGPGADTCVTCHAPGRPGGSPHAGTTPAGDPRRDKPCRRCHGEGR
jgi:hypothetical protein